MDEPFRPSRAAALAAVDLAGGAALYPASPGLALLLVAAGVLVLCGALHRTMRYAGATVASAPRRS